MFQNFDSSAPALLPFGFTPHEACENVVKALALIGSEYKTKFWFGDWLL